MPQSQPANPPIPDPVFSSKDALLEEYAAIIRNDWVDGKPPPRTTQWLRENEAELCAAPKTALCLSGGGIRSAAFCLGALQALAAKGLLGEFNYLSTVSGGGYIGAWLATIMRGGGQGNGALSAANKALTEPADTALRSLRNYTNFLIPEGGFGSSDTWSAIVLWLRNVLLNWLVFAPVLLALAIVPLLYRELLWDVSPFWGVVALLAGLACLLTGTIMGCRSLPTHAYDRDKDPKTHRYGVAASTAQRWIVAPVLAWTFLAPLWFSAVSAEQSDTVPFLSRTFAPVSLGAFVVLLAGYGIAALTLTRHSLGRVRMERRLLGNRRRAQRIPAATRGDARAADAGDDARGAGPALDHRRAGAAQHALCRTALDRRLRRARSRMAGAAERREADPRAHLERARRRHADPADAGVRAMADHLCRDCRRRQRTDRRLARTQRKSFGAGSSADKTGAAWWTGMMREAAITIATLLFAATLFMLLGRLGAISSRSTCASTSASRSGLAARGAASTSVTSPVARASICATCDHDCPVPSPRMRPVRPSMNTTCGEPGTS